MDIEKILISIMKGIKERNKPKREDYSISSEIFGSIIEDAISEGYIKNAKVVRGGQGNKVINCLIEGSKVTLKGERYLRENNALQNDIKN